MTKIKKTSKSSDLHLVDHPLALDKLFRLRDENTKPHDFRRLVTELSEIITYEITRDLQTTTKSVTTPLMKTQGTCLKERVVFVPIMRAGIAMLDGAQKLIPEASVGHIGIYRDKFVKHTVEYYFRLPQKLDGKRIIVLDPMLATGDTAVAAIRRLKDYDVGRISFGCIMASKEGLGKLKEAHPDVEVFAVSLEPKLNDKGYILPGMGDAGDRIYGT